MINCVKHSGSFVDNWIDQLNHMKEIQNHSSRFSWPEFMVRISDESSSLC